MNAQDSDDYLSAILSAVDEQEPLAAAPAPITTAQDAKTVPSSAPTSSLPRYIRPKSAGLYEVEGDTSTDAASRARDYFGDVEVVNGVQKRAFRKTSVVLTVRPLKAATLDVPPSALTVAAQERSSSEPATGSEPSSSVPTQAEPADDGKGAPVSASVTLTERLRPGLADVDIRAQARDASDLLAATLAALELARENAGSSDNEEAVPAVIGTGGDAMWNRANLRNVGVPRALMARLPLEDPKTTAGWEVVLLRLVSDALAEADPNPFVTIAASGPLGASALVTAAQAGMPLGVLDGAATPVTAEQVVASWRTAMPKRGLDPVKALSAPPVRWPVLDPATASALAAAEDVAAGFEEAVETDRAAADTHDAIADAPSQEQVSSAQVLSSADVEVPDASTEAGTGREATAGTDPERSEALDSTVVAAAPAQAEAASDAPARKRSSRAKAQPESSDTDSPEGARTTRRRVRKPASQVDAPAGAASPSTAPSTPATATTATSPALPSWKAEALARKEAAEKAAYEETVARASSSGVNGAGTGLRTSGKDR